MAVAVERLLELAPLHRAHHHKERIVVVEPHARLGLVAALLQIANAGRIHARLDELGHLVEHARHMLATRRQTAHVRRALLDLAVGAIANAQCAYDLGACGRAVVAQAQVGLDVHDLAEARECAGKHGRVVRRLEAHASSSFVSSLSLLLLFAA